MHIVLKDGEEDGEGGNKETKDHGSRIAGIDCNLRSCFAAMCPGALFKTSGIRNSTKYQENWREIRSSLLRSFRGKTRYTLPPRDRVPAKKQIC